MRDPGERRCAEYVLLYYGKGIPFDQRHVFERHSVIDDFGSKALAGVAQTTLVGDRSRNRDVLSRSGRRQVGENATKVLLGVV